MVGKHVAHPTSLKNLTMTQQNLRIKNPSLTLYAFHLRTDMTKEVVTDADHLWEKLTQLSDNLSMPELQTLPEKLICYKNGKYHPAGEQGQRTDYLELIQPERELRFSSVVQDDLTLSGSLYPLRLHDTYAVDFTVFFKNQDKQEAVDIKHLRRFNPKDCLMPSHIQASLGQTLLLYAEPFEGAIADKDLADECVKALLQEEGKNLTGFQNLSGLGHPSLSNQAKLFGSPIFEYETIPQLDAPHPNERTHILVWLGKPVKTLELAEKANFDLINLLSCRHKILFAYYQAHQSNHLARQIYKALDNKSEQLHQLPKAQEKRLALLEAILNNTSDDTFEYARHLRNLDDHRTTIQTNSTNYAKWLEHIRGFCLPVDHLTFLDEFYAHTCQHHQQQIDVYLNYLKPGHHLFEQVTTTILGLVHIGEQKQQMIRARKFEFLITFIGAAVGTGAISATVIPEPPNLIDLVSHFFDMVQLPLFEMPQWFNNIVPPENILNVMFHLFIGGVTALVFTPLISFISRLFTGK
jgi:hypothetical protein